MELDMADVLLGGFPTDYKLVSIRLQLKDGGIEIGPPKPPIRSIIPSNQDYDDGDSDGVANLILQVYNEHAEEVEIEYQPVTKQEDTRWGFWCDGHTLKTVIPYKFWKTHWYPAGFGKEHEPQHHQLQLHNVIRRSGATRPISSSTQAICGANECNIASNNSTLEPSSPNSFLMAGINICQCHSQNNNNKGSNKATNKSKRQENCSRQVSTALQPIPVGGPVQSDSARAGSDTRVIKVRCQRPPGSPASSEDFELAIKVRCSRPVSPIQQVLEPETTIKCSRPASPAQVSETSAKTRQQLSSTEASERTTKARQISSSTEASERMVESRCTTPSSTAEALARAKEALARVQQISQTRAKSSSGSSSDSFDRLLILSESPTPTPPPCVPSETLALARAKDALSRVLTNRPLKPAPSTPKVKPPCRSLANTEVYVRAVATPVAIPPVLPHTMPCGDGDALMTPPALEHVTSTNYTPAMKKSFSGDTSDLMDSWPRGTLETGFGQQSGGRSIVVGQVVVKDAQKVDTMEVWRAAFGKFISKEKANISKHHKKAKAFLKVTIEFMCKERANFVKHQKKSKEFLKETIEFISKEKDAILTQGRKYFAAKRKELDFARLEFIFCLRVAPSMVDPDGNVNWKSLNDVKNWKNTQMNGQHNKSSLLVTTGTNTVACAPMSVDGQSQT